MHAEVGMTAFLRDKGYAVNSMTLKLSQGLTQYVPEVCTNISYYPVIDFETQSNLIFYKVCRTTTSHNYDAGIARMVF